MIPSRKSFSRGPAAYKRNTSSLNKPSNLFLIVTEGEKTEPIYLKKLRDRLHLVTAQIEFSRPMGTDPLTLTKHAIDLMDTRKKEAKKSLKSAYDEVWVVFDLEKIHSPRRQQVDRSIKFGEPRGIKFASSDPCFEYWLLLHNEYTTAPFLCCDDVISRLKKEWPEYEKNCLPSFEFIEKLPFAIKNSDCCQQYHEKSGGCGNPSTKMAELARKLNEAASESFRFNLQSK